MPQSQNTRAAGLVFLLAAHTNPPILPPPAEHRQSARPRLGPLSAHPVSDPFPPKCGLVRSHSCRVSWTYRWGSCGNILPMFKLLRGDGLEICCGLGGKESKGLCRSGLTVVVTGVHAAAWVGPVRGDGPGWLPAP